MAVVDTESCIPKIFLNRFYYFKVYKVGKQTDDGDRWGFKNIHKVKLYQNKDKPNIIYGNEVDNNPDRLFKVDPKEEYQFRGILVFEKGLWVIYGLNRETNYKLICKINKKNFIWGFEIVESPSNLNSLVSNQTKAQDDEITQVGHSLKQYFPSNTVKYVEFHVKDTSTKQRIIGISSSNEPIFTGDIVFFNDIVGAKLTFSHYDRTDRVEIKFYNDDEDVVYAEYLPVGGVLDYVVDKNVHIFSIKGFAPVSNILLTIQGL